LINSHFWTAYIPFHGTEPEHRVFDKTECLNRLKECLPGQILNRVKVHVLPILLGVRHSPAEF